MTERIGNIVIICSENPQQCDFCGKIRELRPYGPKGECICYECGLKDIETTEAMMVKKLYEEKINNKYLDITK
jgi:hypothetical protein